MMENKKQSEWVKLPTAIMNDVLSYLGTKPFIEVAPYINAIQREHIFVEDAPKAIEPGLGEPVKE